MFSCQQHFVTTDFSVEGKKKVKNVTASGLFHSHSLKEKGKIFRWENWIQVNTREYFWN